jgi:hypothetical protein
MKHFLLLTVVIFSACGVSKENNDSQSGSEYSTVSSGPFLTQETNFTDDQYKINAVQVIDNQLIVEVSFGGGCADHAFQLVGSTNVSKSLPPQRAIRLYHNANNDGCEAWITKTLTFDISSFAYQQNQGYETILNLFSWEQPISYIFKTK